MNPLVDIIIPTRRRSGLLTERLRVLERNTPELHNDKAVVTIAYDVDDPETREVISKNFGYFHISPNLSLALPCDKWNKAAANSRAEWLVTMSDDSIPHPDWLTNALGMISYGFLGLPDGITGERNKMFTPLYMATRQWLKDFNGGVLVLPMYKSWYADIETCERAKRSGTWMLADRSVVEQVHECFGTAPNDEIYELGKTRRVEDFKTFMRRRNEGYPNDFKGVL